MTDTDYGIFAGDGRIHVSPCDVTLPAPAQVFPMSLSRGQARRVINHFLEVGHSTHSAQGSTLWVLQHWAAVNRESIIIEQHIISGKTAGYSVRRVKS